MKGRKKTMGTPTNCKGCIYYKYFDWARPGGLKCCHYIIDTGHSRAKNGDKCMSRKEKAKKGATK